MIRRPAVASLTVILSILVLGLCSCATFYSSYFERPKEKPQVLDNFHLYSRVFGYIDVRSAEKQKRGNAFAITVRVERANSAYEHYDWRTDQKTVDSLADEFLKEMTAVFVPDSLLLYETPSEDPPLVLIPDQTNYSPRRDDYLTLKFGDIHLRNTTVGMRAVLHVTRQGQSPSADSVAFQMGRVELEEYGLYSFTSETLGY